MKDRIPFVAFDPSFSNWGIAKLLVNIHSLEIEVEDLVLVKTEREDKKDVVKTSSDLVRARTLKEAVVEHCQGRVIAVSEVPLGNAAIYKNAIYSAGIVTGVLASCPIPLIEVSPQEVKLAAIGTRQGAKEEMIAWALAKHPTAPWLYTKGAKPRLQNGNEHLADALAAGYAGLHKSQFQQALAMYRAAIARAA